MGKTHRPRQQSTPDAEAEALTCRMPDEAGPFMETPSMETSAPVSWFMHEVHNASPAPVDPDACELDPSWAPVAGFSYGASYEEGEEAWTENNLRARIHYSDGLATKEHQPKAAAIMRALLAQPPKRGVYPDALYDLAALRDYDDCEVEQMWDVFCDAKAEQAKNQKADDPVPGLDEAEHPEHMASLAQLRFGSYVADTLGGRAGVDLDPVFGALLSPTGGLVGPGNGSYSAKNLSADGMHGEAHDAFGYLSAHHGSTISPGYTYADQAVTPEFAPTWQQDEDAPLSGQASGFALWKKLLAEEGHADPRSVSEITEDSMFQVFKADNPNLPKRLPSFVLDPRAQEMLYDVFMRRETSPIRTGGMDKMVDGAEKLKIEHAEKGTMGMIKDRLPEPIPYAQPLTWDGWLR